MRLHLLTIALFFLLSNSNTAQNALHFDGNDDYVELTDFKGVTGNNDRTIEAWIRVPPGATNHGIVCWGTNTASQKWTFRIQNTSGNVDGNIRIECNGGYKTGSTDLRDSLWHHVAVVWANDGTPNIVDALLYVDGVLETTNAQLSYNVNTASGSNVRIGRRHPNNGFFDGGIDEVRIWSEARSQAEIVANMNKEICQDSALVAYHSFNQGTAFAANTDSISIDKSINHKDGALTNFALVGDTSNWVTGPSLTPANPPQIQFTGSFHNTCFGDTNGTVSSTVTGGVSPYDYEWSTGETSTSLSNLGAGSYTLRIVDDSLCATDTTVIITEGEQILTNLVSTGVTCADDVTGAITANASGGTGSLSFLWSNGSTMQSPTGLTVGNYSVTITDSVGCTAMNSAAVPMFFDSLKVEVKTLYDVNCPGDTGGYVLLDIKGGQSPYSVLWDDPLAQTTNPASFLPEGMYTATVTDNNACEAEMMVTIDHIGEFPVVDLGSNINTGDPSVTLTAPAGYASYQWSTNSTQPSITVQTNGTYTVTVADSAGCEGQDDIKVKFFPSGVTALNANSNWKVYPNPARDQITVEGAASGSVSYELRDALGRLVYVETANEQAINTLKLPPTLGMYVLVIKSELGTEYIQVLKEN